MNFLERTKSLVGVGAFGSITISAVGDFLAPRGGWVLTLAAGIVGALLLVYALFCPPGKNKLRSLTEGGDKPSRWWVGSRWGQHGVHVLAIFTVVCLVVGTKSYSNASNGGILGSHFSLISDVQSTTGLLRQSIIEQQKTQADMERLVNVVKKERSSNPRKELMNLGVTWSEANFQQAFDNHDTINVELFLQGGMPVPVNVVDAFMPGGADLLALVEKYKPTVRRSTSGPATCQAIAYVLEGKLDVAALEKVAANARAKDALRGMCAEEVGG